jgi:outer membrane protein insertion porin family
VKRLLPKAIALALLLCPPPVRAEEAGEPVVTAIQVEGNRRVEVDAIKAAVGTKVGQALDPKKIQADVRAVMKLGFFSDVVVEERGQKDGVTVVFRVT